MLVQLQCYQQAQTKAIQKSFINNTATVVIQTLPTICPFSLLLHPLHNIPLGPGFSGVCFPGAERGAGSQQDIGIPGASTGKVRCSGWGLLPPWCWVRLGLFLHFTFTFTVLTQPAHMPFLFFGSQSISFLFSSTAGFTWFTRSQACSDHGLTVICRDCDLWFY